MRLSTKAHYGLNVCYYLAEEYENEGKEVPLKKLANLSGITESYLEQIMLLLKKANIVDATRGAFGGYYLTRDPSSIVIGDVVRALEDNLEILSCIKSDSECKCVIMEKCKTREVWKIVKESINNSLDKIKLNQLIDLEK